MKLSILDNIGTIAYYYRNLTAATLIFRKWNLNTLKQKTFQNTVLLVVFFILTYLYLCIIFIHILIDAHNMKKHLIVSIGLEYNVDEEILTAVLVH